MSKLFFAVFLSCVAGSVQAEDDGQTSAWSYFGDARLRYEHTELPTPVNNIYRNRLRARGGILFMPSDVWEFGAALEASAGTDGNDLAKRNRDNERSNDVTLDQFYARVNTGEHSSWTIGKTNLQMDVSAMLWDADHRPIGLSMQTQLFERDYSNLSFGAGYFAPRFVFDNYQPRMSAAQLAWHVRPGAPTSGSVLLSYLGFSNLKGLPARGIGRTNRQLAGNYVSDYRTLDLQLIGRSNVGDWPLTIRVEGARNFGASTLRDAGRMSVAAGNAREGGLEFDLVYQRTGRDAVLSIAADDDWWFQSFARGTLGSLSYGFGEGLTLRIAGFYERRDALDTPSKRLLIDISKQW
jgi:hypothetical protein